MLGGYAGKLLFVNLSKGSINEELLPESVCREFVGGYGLGIRVLYEKVKAGVAPLGEENMLGIVTGVLTATSVPGSGRYGVVTKSPLTGAWSESNAGGTFGPELKTAGYDAVFFCGISPRPVYLLIHEGKAELKDASHLWGKDAYETQDLLLQSFLNHQADILVGTQMIAKGLHFPNVTLIGVMHADMGLHMPDFRAGERTQGLPSCPCDLSAHQVRHPLPHSQHSTRLLGSK